MIVVAILTVNVAMAQSTTKTPLKLKDKARLSSNETVTSSENSGITKPTEMQTVEAQPMKEETAKEESAEDADAAATQEGDEKSATQSTRFSKAKKIELKEKAKPAPTAVQKK